MKKKILVTGLGVISTAGTDKNKLLQSLQTPNIQQHEFFKTAVNIAGNPFPEKKLGEVRILTRELVVEAGFEEAVVPRTTLLAAIAARQAIQDSGFTEKEIITRGNRIAFIFGTSTGGMDLTEQLYYQKENQTQGKIKNRHLHDCGSQAWLLASYLGIHGYILTVSTACSSSANSILFAARLIQQGLVDYAVAGGADALTRFTIGGFGALKIIDAWGCRPFDNQRQGMTPGEGAGFLFLQAEGTELKNKPYCFIAGYGNSCDAFHQTASSPEGTGATFAMQKALKNASLTPKEIQYINAHGTGTINNDLSECKAFEKVFGQNPPPFSSTKGYTGHTLGAAGGIEAVICALSLQYQCIFPNLGFQNPMKEVSFIPVTSLQKEVPLKNVLSNSFGFGGNSTSLIFSAL